MKLEGIIIKGIGGFYYVETSSGLYECRARGLFRNINIKPLIGDYVVIDITDEKQKKGHVIIINDRKVELIRPHVANVEQVIITMAVKDPRPNYILLDKLIVLAQYNGLEPIICFNKVDLNNSKEIDEIASIYINAGYKFVITSIVDNSGIEELKKIMKGSINVFAGPSGVGKSSLVNAMMPGLELKVGDISKKIKRGKHTTRHSELIELNFGGFVLDTPGFTSLDLTMISINDLKEYFREFSSCNQCKYNDCKHVSEPGCEVKRNVENSTISKMRYESYLYIYNELLQRKERY